MRRMSLTHCAIISLVSSFSMGIIAPVLSLMLMDKGLDLSTLAFTLGAYSLVVLATEIPSGFFSDRFGRKRCFIIAKTFSIVSVLVLVGSTSMVRLATGMLFFGLARSFSSGSFEALCVDWYLKGHGENRLSRISTMISLWETIGLSVGALLSGAIVMHASWLPTGFGRYDANLLASGACNFIVLLLSALWVEEKHHWQEEDNEGHARFSVRGTLTAVRGNRTLMPLFVSAAATGILLSSVETYWQPRLLQVMHTPSLLWLVGFLASLGFLSAIGGNLLSAAVLDNRPKKVLPWYVLNRVLLAAMMVALAAAGTTGFYILAYSGVYLALGMANIAENVLVNRETQSHMRSSVLSISSFCVQGGALLASLTAGLLMRSPSGTIGILWRMAAAVTAITAMIVAIRGGRLKKELNNTSQESKN